MNESRIKLILICLALFVPLIIYSPMGSKGIDRTFDDKSHSVFKAIQSQPRETPEPIDETWFQSVSESLSLAEYNIRLTKDNGTYSGPNRKHNLRTHISSGQLLVENRVDSLDHNWDFSLSTVGVFADTKLWATALDNPEARNHENVLELDHQFFVEQYENSRKGLRQNFIIRDLPSSTQEVRVRIAAKGVNIRKSSATELTFTNGLTTLAYQDLRVWDANHQPLAAHFELQEDNEFDLVVETAFAELPITIDPIIVNGDPSNANTTLESNQSNAQMGFSVSSAGDVNGDGYSDVIVGAWLYDNGENSEGAAFVYHGSISGLNTAADITIESNQVGATIGRSVSTAGDVNGDGYSDVIVGANLFDNGEADEGVAYVYHGSAIGLGAVAATILESNQADAELGISVSSAGDVNGDGYSDVIVGASSYSNGQFGEGAAFVYHGSAAGITTTANVMMESNQANARMGITVSSAGDVNGDGYSDVIVGADLYDNGQANEGSAFVYYGSATGISAIADVTYESNQVGAQLGFSVSSAGDVDGDGYSDVIVGAVNYENGESNEGAAFVYHGSAGGLGSIANIILESNQIDGRMGSSVSLAGDINGDGYSDVIVGARDYDNGEINEGTAFVYQGSASGLAIIADATLESNQANARMGFSVSSAGDVNGDGYSDVIVGAYRYSNGQSQEGAAFVYLGSASGLPTIVNATLESDQASALMGYSVSSAGDVNGDGYGDVIVGVPGYDNGEADEGAVFVYHGSISGLSTITNTMLESNQANAYMGISVSSAGDVNGDGYVDVIVGAYLYENGETDEGTAFVYHGSSSGLSTVAAATLESNQASAEMGWDVSSAGDVNGDGYADVLVGALRYDNGESNEGATFVFHGSVTGLSPIVSTILESNQANSNMGTSVSSAGDVNGDGYADVIVGASQYDNGETNEGVAFVFHGSTLGLSTIANTTLENNQSSIQMGVSVSSAGDVNGDGYADVLVGASNYSNGEAFEGAAFVFHGSVTGLSTIANTILESNQANAQMGFSVSSAGDVNGDGYSDVVIGAYVYDNGEANEGTAFVFHGSGTGLSTIANTILESNQANAQMGFSVSSAGDVNGDGYSDVIVGAYNYDNGESNEGAAFVYYGNEGGGLRRNMQLYNSSTTTSIQQANTLETDFALGLYAKSPDGRTNGKLVWETQAQGQPFNGSPVTSHASFTDEQSTYSDLGVAGIELTANASKVGDQTKVRARIKYDPVTSLTGQVYSPWIYPPGYFDSQGNNAAPLPIELLHFDAHFDGSGVAVNWKTAIEINNDFFSVERSIDGIKWEPFAKVPGAGNSKKILNYEVMDKSPHFGLSYYRLKQTDYDKRFSYSSVENVVVDQGILHSVEIYPNPVSVLLTIKGDARTLSSVKVFNLSGKMINVSSVKRTADILNIDFSQVPSGIYLVQTIEGTKRVRVR